MTVTWCTPGVAGLGHKRSAEKSRTVDSSVGGGGSSGVMNAARLEGQAVCKTERLQAISTPLGPYDKNYSRKRIREHSLERADCELHVCSRDGFNLRSHQWTRLTFPFFLSSSLPQTLHGLEHPLHDSSQHALVPAQPPNTPAVHIFRELCAAGPEQPECPEHACKDATPDLTPYLDDSNHQSGVFINVRCFVLFLKQALLRSYILLMTFIYFSSCVEIWWFHMAQDDKHSIKKMCSRESLRRGVCGKAVL